MLFISKEKRKIEYRNNEEKNMGSIMRVESEQWPILHKNLRKETSTQEKLWVGGA